MGLPKKNQSTASITLIEHVRSSDILLGRGGGGYQHAGNRRYHNVMARESAQYIQCQTRKEKTELAWSIFADLGREGARFLKKDKISGLYFQAKDLEARRKISQRLRELALEARENPQEELRLAQQPEKVLSERKKDEWEPLDPWTPGWSLRSLATTADWASFLQEAVATTESIDQDDESWTGSTAMVSVDSDGDHECKLSELDSFGVPEMATMVLSKPDGFV